ncbi:MAG: branched-chain amino acid ABC transporter permease [Candidatus Carbobacillus sp.]|nr:branched-chain amino acid ABC transporter permease [Candidatus Carbobacillus sp.]
MHIRSLYSVGRKTWGFILIVIVYPLIFQNDNYLLSLGIIVGLFGLVTTGLLLLTGYAGQVSLGQAAFYGIGAYTSAYTTARLALPPLVGLLLGMMLAMVAAYLIGLAVFRLREHYLALATLGFGAIAYTLFKNLKQITGGLDGFFGIPPFSIFGLTVDSDFSFYWVVWFFVLLGLWFAGNVLNARSGRALRAVHDSEFAADALGINVFRLKLHVFVLSAAYAAFAGGLYAHYVSFINPQLFDVVASITFLAMVIIGGDRFVGAGVLGAAVYVSLGEAIKSFLPVVFPKAGGEFELVFFGVLIVVIMIFLPGGLSGLGSKLIALKAKRVAEEGGEG